MKILRFQTEQGEILYGEDVGEGWAEVVDLFEKIRKTGRKERVYKILAPIVPPLLVGIGLNYRKHAQETGAKFPQYPVVFMKPSSAVQNPGDPILLPRQLRSDEVDYECELAIVLSQNCKNAHVENALEYILGYTCANDVSARDWQKQKGGGQWSRGKGFDTFAPLGPVLVTTDEIPDPNILGIRTILNGQIVQDGNTSDMIFPVRELIAFLSGSTTLPQGTVILTGTPHGVGMARKPPLWLRAGDTVTVAIEGIGCLTNPVKEEISADIGRSA